MSTGLTKQLSKSGTMQGAEIKRIEAEARKNKRSFFAQALLEDKIDREIILQNAAIAASMATFDIDRVTIDDLPLSELPDQTLRDEQVLPLSKHQKCLFVAIGDPDNKSALKQARFHNNMAITPVLCDPSKLESIINTIESSDDALASFDALPDEINLRDLDLEATDEGGDQGAVDLDLNNPIVQYVNKVLKDAISQGASDIHIEPYENIARIRYRIDGILHSAGDPPLKLVQNIASRIKVLARLDIAERRLPQDGRIKIRFSRTRTIDFRVSTMPTLFGEKVVLRILDQSANDLKLATLGMEPNQLVLYQQATKQPHGMILVTGPTGSGKTVTLYSALAVLNKPDTNISSVEDPVEIYADGVNQVSINEKSGLTFARTLRAFLRQDPDILMVGEIRDLETADIAIKAAQTGHLVLSTLHTNDAPSAITRLINMGVAPFNIASTVNLVIAQRLVRRLCSACKKPTKLPTTTLLEAGFSNKQIKQATIFSPVGCGACSNGYKGRTGIFEVMPVSDETAELIMIKATEAEISRQVRKEGTLTLKAEGIKKVAAGITSLAEVERITKN